MREFASTVLSPYLTYVGFFLGIGLVSGSIVHFPVNPLRYAAIGSIGILLFIAASLVDEIVLKKKPLRESGILRVILFSVVLSMGIGMISGAIQHFTDTPKYAAILIPMGIVISLVGFLLKSQIRLTRTMMGWSFACVLLICIPLGIVLNIVASDLSIPHEHTAEHHS